MNKHKKPRESTDEFCKRLGIKRITQKGGVEFVPSPRLSRESEAITREDVEDERDQRD